MAWWIIACIVCASMAYVAGAVMASGKHQDEMRFLALRCDVLKAQNDALRARLK